MPLLAAALLMFATDAAAERPVTALLRDGLVELQSGDLPHARADLESASRVAPTNAVVWSALMQVYARTGDRKLASDAAANAERYGKSNPVISHALAIFYSETGDYAKAAAAELRYSESPKADADAKFRAASWFIAAGETPEAMPLAISAAQQNADQAFYLAQELLRASKFAEAGDLVQASLAKFPNNAQLTLALGVARYSQRRFEDAIALFLKVIEIDPAIEQPYVFLGKMLDQAGSKLAQIATVCEHWAKANPQNAEAQVVLAKVLLSQDPRSAEAGDLLRKAVALAPGDWEAHYELGLQLESSRDYTAAVSELLKAAQIAPNQPEPHYHLARVYDRLGQAAAAAEQRSIHQQLTSNTARSR